MPAISRVRLTNIIYENGAKRFNDDIFEFDGHNGVILLENGGGKTVLIQTVLQAVLPHSNLGERRIQDTLSLEGGASHIAIEWILNDRPRRYGITAVTLFLAPEGLRSLRYAYDYSSGDDHSIENLPFVKENREGNIRPTGRQEIQEYYQYMQNQKLNAHTFDTIKDFHQYIEENFHIIPSEWRSIARINGAEGDVEKFFEKCKTTSQLVDQMLIPTVEEALVGNGTGDFVQIFERQREHFKKHKELRRRIEESKNIEERISHYVSIYTKLHEAEEKMFNKKREAKSIYEFLEEEETQVQNEKSHIEELKDILSKEEWELNRKKASYELATLEKELNATKDDYEIIALERMEIDDMLKKKEEELQNLEIAELKAHIKQEEERVGILKKQLDELDQDQQIVDLKARLEENSSILKGYFEKEKDGLEKQKELWVSQKNRYEKELEIMHKKTKDLREKKQDVIEERASYKGEVKSAESHMEAIKKSILVNPINETVAGEYPKWKGRIEEIEKININNKDYLKKLMDKKENLSREIPDINNEIQELIKNTTTKENHLDFINREHDKILAIVKGLRLEWHYLDSIYLKQQSAIQYIEERLEKTRAEKEKLLEGERLSYRLLDFYGKNEYFTGEPMLENWIDNWKNQFHLLELGARYIEKTASNLGKDLEEIYKEYPLWPLVVITSEGELGKLSRKIEGQREKLTLPILILSQEEAVNIILGKKKVEERYVYPFIWKENIDKEKFQLWKGELEQSTKKAVEARKNKEREEKDWQDILEKINEFLSMYPYDEYSQLTEELKALKEKLTKYKNLLDKKQRESIALDREIGEHQTKLKNLEQESNYLERKIERALDYFEKEKEVERLKSQLYMKNEELDRIEKEILLNKKDKKTKEYIVQEAREKISNIINQISRILDDPNYREVKDFKAWYKNIGRDSILEEREYIKDMLSEKQKDRPEIERQLKEAKKNWDKDKELLKRKYIGANYPVDEGIEYPYNGKILIQSLVEDVRKLGDKLERVDPHLRKAEKSYEKKANRYEIRLEGFYEEFHEIVHFSQPLPSIRKQLSQEKLELDEKQKYLKSNHNRLKEELEDIKSHVQNLKIENGRYEFLTNNIKGIILSTDIKQDLPYRRKDIISKAIDDMEVLTKDLKNHRERVDMERNKFIQFLNENVRDIRLREMAISGVRNKKFFEEILEWQRNMEKTLNRVMRIHEKNMMEHDKELNQFIQYLYTYLSTLADEIRTIPKSTKVKIGDNWKEIYQIQMPSWEEEDGKEEIRKHVDWMIGKLEDDEFLDDEGKEDGTKVRRSIEKWLQSKQLLNIIMLGKEIKVKCRKVTNDGKVSNMYYSWESSNQWSGGEKWSKNMALFLGILNYVAEKKQHISPNQRRNRTVIMDNPFGKASSDHILSPVFFIAEQLGFQFIALTAHGEGRFIRDYFPVVYSCKLRPSVGGDTSILTKEKNINYAFFKDNDPMVIERIGDREQLNMFEI